MSAAATAAGYLYASGRLRGRNGRDNNEQPDNDHHRDNARHYREEQPRAAKPAVKVAVYQPEPQPASGAPKKAPKIQYRTRRWRPE